MTTVDGVEYTEDCFEPTGTSSRTRSHIKRVLRDRLKDTYGSTKYKEFLKIQGFDDSRFDYVGSVMNMMYADLTTDGIDNNANKDCKSISRVEAEVDNANHKIAGHDALYRMMKKLYGKDEAVRLSSEMYDYTLGLNDATKILRVYCWALSGIPLVLEGRKGNPVCAPAKHLHSYVSMLAGTIHELSNSHLAGAIAVGSFFFDVARVMIMDGYSLDDIKEGAGRKYVTQMFQQFVFDVNDKTRIGSETPFTNLSFFDRPKMRAMLEDLEWYFDATGKDLDYIQEYVMECQRIMMDFMDIGDPITKLPFTFPVQTACIAKDKEGNILDMEFVSDLVKRPVHHYNILVSEGTKIASCCRLLSDGDMMNNAGSVNSFGGGGSISMGSHRVVCINLNRCAIMSESEEDFVKKFDALVYDCVKILKAHKELLYKLTEVGLQPKIADGTIDLSRCFSTVGTLGLWEMLQTLEKKFGVDEDRDVRVMKHFNETCLKAGKQYGLNVNIEAIPGEAMAERFCKSDKLLFGEKTVPYEIYSNQTVPLTEKVDVYDRMDKDGRINLLLTGGGIVHLTIGERITSEQALNLIKYAVKSCCEHFALNLVHSMCEDGHVSEGKYTTCPVCGKPVVDYALRIVGFLRPVSSWSKTRKNEFYNRYIIQNNTIKSA